MVERAAPDGVHARHELPRALEHLARGAVGEREQKDTLRRHALLHQIGDAVHERARLARAGGGQHEERTVRRRRRRALLAVENSAEIYSVHDKLATAPFGRFAVAIIPKYRGTFVPQGHWLAYGTSGVPPQYFPQARRKVRGVQPNAFLKTAAR